MTQKIAQKEKQHQLSLSLKISLSKEQTEEKKKKKPEKGYVTRTGGASYLASTVCCCEVCLVLTRINDNKINISFCVKQTEKHRSQPWPLK